MIFAILAFFLFAIVLVAISATLNGIALSIVWSWFMVPIFGLPELSIPAAIGVTAILSFMTYHDVDAEPEKDEDKFLKSLLNLILRPVVFVLFAWVVKSFM